MFHMLFYRLSAAEAKKSKSRSPKGVREKQRISRAVRRELLGIAGMLLSKLRIQKRQLLVRALMC